MLLEDSLKYAAEKQAEIDSLALTNDTLVEPSDNEENYEDEF